MLDLHEQLTNMDDGTILTEVALRVPPAISWLPQAVQKILAAKVTLGQAIMEAASQSGAPTQFNLGHLVQLADLNEAVRARSSSPDRSGSSRGTPRTRSSQPNANIRPKVEPPVPTYAATKISQHIWKLNQ